MPTEFDTGMEPYQELQERDEDIPEDPTQQDARPISTQSLDWSISVLRENVEDDLIDLQPHFQRQYVWEQKPALPPRLIESLLLEIPIPPIYLGTLPDGRMEIIDGQQRLTTLLKFVKNEFPLRYLEKLPSLNGKYFRDLSRDQQSKIRLSPIRTVKVDAGYNVDLRYELFERLNRGSMPLNEAELRNCVFHGPLSDLLKELESDPAWRKVKGGDRPEPRYVEREMILRFLTFSNRVDFYTGGLKRFLNNYMKANAHASDEQISELRAMFQQTMRNIYAVFGTHSGRLYSAGTETRSSRDGKWETKFSVSAFDIQASALIGLKPIVVQTAAEQIREAYLLYWLTSPDVRLAVSRQPANARATKTRWFGFKDRVRELLDDIEVEPRFFSYDFRKQLYDESQVCQLCHNQIHSLEDATVDHIHPYSKDGKTVPENAQLAHRSCNAKKCANVESAVASNDLSAITQIPTHLPINAQTSATRARTGPKQSQQPVLELDRLVPRTLHEDFSYKQPYGFVLSGQAYKNVGSWRSLYQLICRQLAQKDPRRFEQLLTNPSFISRRGLREFSKSPSTLRNAVPVENGIYVEGNHSANGIRDLLRRLLTEFGLKSSDLTLYLREDRDAEAWPISRPSGVGSESADAPFKPGDRVRHPLFGEGQVIIVAPSGSDHNVTVMFRSAGKKMLSAKAGKLEHLADVQPHAEVTTWSGRNSSVHNQRVVRELDREKPYTLYDDFTYTRPFGFKLEGQIHKDVPNWLVLYKLICQQLAQKDPRRFEQLPTNPSFTSTRGRREFSTSRSALQRAVPVGNGIYVEGLHSANDMMNKIKDLLAEFSIPPTAIAIYLRERRDAE